MNKIIEINGLMAGWTGLEPATSGVTGRRSNQLNYHPIQEFAKQILEFKVKSSKLKVMRMPQKIITHNS